MSKKKITTEKETKKIEDGYPLYSISEDIYAKGKETNIDPEDISKIKKSSTGKKTSGENEMDFEEDETGSDLDVPGSELDDDQEAIGSEDEENNSYSIGGDNHNNLEDERE